MMHAGFFCGDRGLDVLRDSYQPLQLLLRFHPSRLGRLCNTLGLLCLRRSSTRGLDSCRVLGGGEPNLADELVVRLREESRLLAQTWKDLALAQSARDLSTAPP